MSGLFSNPEFVRRVRGQLRPGKLLAAAVLSAAISVCVAYLYSREPGEHVAGPHDWGIRLLEFSLGVQALVLAAGGAIACLNSIYKEKEQNTFDFQRVTRLTPFQLALGKLFGAPVLMYFICLCFVPLAVFSAFTAKARLSFFLAAYVVLLVASLAFHALALLISLLTIRGSNAGSIVLLLLLLWLGAYPGSSFQMFRVGSLSPFLAPSLVSEVEWKVTKLHRSIDFQGRDYALPTPMIDAVFGHEVHHAFVVIPVDLALALLLFLAVVRNIKRDPNYYELYSPSQVLALALFLNLLAAAFYQWQKGNPVDTQAIFLVLNMFLFFSLGLALLRNREQMRKILRAASAPQGSWITRLWPAPILLPGTVIAGAVAVEGIALWRDPHLQWSAGFALLRSLFFVLWIIRDVQYLQWMSLRRGKHPLVMAVLFLSIFYACINTLLTAFGYFRLPERAPFPAFFVPSPVFRLDAGAWLLRPAIWTAAYVVQLTVIGVFLYLQQERLRGLAPLPSTPATPMAKTIA